MTDNILLADWEGPLGGVPPLDRVRIEDFEPAVQAAIAERKIECAAVRSIEAPPTFDNTVGALEKTGRKLDDVLAVYFLWGSNFTTDALRPIRMRIAPLLAAVNDDIYQDPVLFQRVQAVAEQPGLTEEQQRVLARYTRSFQSAGAHLDAPGRERVSAINQRLSVARTQFADHVLEDEDGTVTWLTAQQLGGLSEAFIATAKEMAAVRGRPEAWAVANNRSGAEVFLTLSTERDLREAVFRAFTRRGESKNKGLVTEILALRAERAALLGFEDHAAKQLAPTMAGNADAVRELLRQVWSAASDKFEVERDRMAELAAEDGITLEPWDVRFYADQARKRDHAFDPSELAQHFQLDRLREGMFWAATQVFGWNFVKADVPLPHPDFSAWRVDNADGSPRGMFYFDPFARPGKRSGAWMTAYRVQSKVDGTVLPIVSNNCNFLKAPGGKPTLLSLDEAETLFHEFGHGIHGLASDVTYPSVAGTAVVRDFVEFPSQLFEHWLMTDPLLERFALHQKTNEPLDTAFLDRVKAAANSDSGFRTLEYLACAVVDLEMHATSDRIAPDEFEGRVLGAWRLPREIVMRHRPTQFLHLFSAESYSAGYYCYLWADALVADAAEAFEEQGFYDQELASRLLDTLVSRGDSVDPGPQYRAFRGRDYTVDALLRDRGFV